VLYVVIQGNTSHHISGAVDVCRLLIRGLILIVAPAIVEEEKASLLALCCAGKLQFYYSKL